jgi:predicted  nucleic acid-binding Zn-ribbon protein
VQTTNSDLQAQMTSISRMSGGGSTMEVRALTARATNAERRLDNVQNQLAAAEEKVADVNQKTHVADNKWEARVKEYESRLKTAEEKIKRERQGGKERVGELEVALKYVFYWTSSN